MGAVVAATNRTRHILQTFRDDVCDYYVPSGILSVSGIGYCHCIDYDVVILGVCYICLLLNSGESNAITHNYAIVPSNQTITRIPARDIAWIISAWVVAARIVTTWVVSAWVVSARVVAARIGRIRRISRVCANISVAVSGADVVTSQDCNIVEICAISSVIHCGGNNDLEHFTRLNIAQSNYQSIGILVEVVLSGRTIHGHVTTEYQALRQDISHNSVLNLVFSKGIVSDCYCVEDLVPDLNGRSTCLLGDVRLNNAFCNLNAAIGSVHRIAVLASQSSFVRDCHGIGVLIDNNVEADFHGSANLDIADLNSQSTRGVVELISCGFAIQQDVASEYHAFRQSIGDNSAADGILSQLVVGSCQSISNGIADLSFGNGSSLGQLGQGDAFVNGHAYGVFTLQRIVDVVGIQSSDVLDGLAISVTDAAGELEDSAVARSNFATHDSQSLGAIIIVEVEGTMIAAADGTNHVFQTFWDHVGDYSVADRNLSGSVVGHGHGIHDDVVILSSSGVSRLCDRGLNQAVSDLHAVAAVGLIGSFHRIAVVSGNGSHVLDGLIIGVVINSNGKCQFGCIARSDVAKLNTQGVGGVIELEVGIGAFHQNLAHEGHALRNHVGKLNVSDSSSSVLVVTNGDGVVDGIANLNNLLVSNLGCIQVCDSFCNSHAVVGSIDRIDVVGVHGGCVVEGLTESVTHTNREFECHGLTRSDIASFDGQGLALVIVVIVLGTVVHMTDGTSHELQTIGDAVCNNSVFDLVLSISGVGHCYCVHNDVIDISSGHVSLLCDGGLYCASSNDDAFIGCIDGTSILASQSSCCRNGLSICVVIHDSIVGDVECIASSQIANIDSQSAGRCIVTILSGSAIQSNVARECHALRNNDCHNAVAQSGLSVLVITASNCIGDCIADLYVVLMSNQCDEGQSLAILNINARIGHFDRIEVSAFNQSTVHDVHSIRVIRDLNSELNTGGFARLQIANCQDQLASLVVEVATSAVVTDSLRTIDVLDAVRHNVGNSYVLHLVLCISGVADFDGVNDSVANLHIGLIGGLCGIRHNLTVSNDYAFIRSFERLNHVICKQSCDIGNGLTIGVLIHDCVELHNNFTARSDIANIDSQGSCGVVVFIHRGNVINENLANEAHAFRQNILNNSVLKGGLSIIVVAHGHGVSDGVADVNVLLVCGLSGIRRNDTVNNLHARVSSIEVLEVVTRNNSCVLDEHSIRVLGYLNSELDLGRFARLQIANNQSQLASLVDIVATSAVVADSLRTVQILNAFRHDIGNGHVLHLVLSILTIANSDGVHDGIADFDFFLISYLISIRRNLTSSDVQATFVSGSNVFNVQARQISNILQVLTIGVLSNLDVEVHHMAITRLDIAKLDSQGTSLLVKGILAGFMVNEYVAQELQACRESIGNEGALYLIFSRGLVSDSQCVSDSIANLDVLLVSGLGSERHRNAVHDLDAAFLRSSQIFDVVARQNSDVGDSLSISTLVNLSFETDGSAITRLDIANVHGQVMSGAVVLVLSMLIVDQHVAEECHTSGDGVGQDSILDLILSVFAVTQFDGINDSLADASNFLISGLCSIRSCCAVDYTNAFLLGSQGLNVVAVEDCNILDCLTIGLVSDCSIELNSLGHARLNVAQLNDQLLRILIIRISSSLVVHANGTRNEDHSRRNNVSYGSVLDFILGILAVANSDGVHNSVAHINVGLVSSLGSERLSLALQNQDACVRTRGRRAGRGCPATATTARTAVSVWCGWGC